LGSDRSVSKPFFLSYSYTDNLFCSCLLAGEHYRIVFIWNSIVHLTALGAWPGEFCF